MSLVSQLWNKTTYLLHSATYDPDAEKFAAEKKAEEERLQNDVIKKKEVSEQQAAAALAAQKAATDAAALAKAEEESNKFDIWRLIGKILGIVFTILLSFLLVVLGVYGSSLATNLNVHHDWPYRVLYAIWGLLFFWLVIPYVLLYRWWWNGHKPRFYALIPLVPYKFDNYYMGIMFSWMSFKPDDVIADLREWEHK